MAAAEQQLARLFGDVYAASGWHPQRRQLAELLANLTATLSSSQGGGWDAGGLAAALLQAAGGDVSTAAALASASLAPSPQPDPSGPVDIGWMGLLLGTLAIGVNGLISVWLCLGLHGKLAVATVRCIVQLSILGYILVPIFNANRWWLTLLYTLFMLAVAALEAVSRPTQTYPGMLLQVLAALGLASSVVLSYGLALVVQVSPWYDPQYLIPMLGMLLGNACSGVAVGLSTILDDLSAGRDKVELLLSMGATRMEATREVVQRASRMALTPLLNTMNVVGIVSIPGMMTGQILGGSDPATAARYQIIIMFLIAASTGAAAVATIFLAVVSLLDDRHRLRAERLAPAGAKGAVAYAGLQMRQAWRALRSKGAHAATRVRLAFAPAPGRTRRGSGAAAVAAYRPLGDGGGGGEGEGGGEAGRDDVSEVPSLPSRLREVLVAGSVGSSATWGDGGSPAAQRPLLGAEASGESASPQPASTWSPRGHIP